MPKSDLRFGSFYTSRSNGRIYKLKPMNLPTPERQVETFEVKGRSGSLLIDYGSFNNVTIEAELALESGNSDTTISLFDEVRSSVMRQLGYQRLEDSDYPDEYRMARPVDATLETESEKNGRMVLTFNAKPQRYLISGDVPAVELERPETPLGLITEGVGNTIFNNTIITWMNIHVPGSSSRSYTCVKLNTNQTPNADHIVIQYNKSRAGVTIETGRCQESPLRGETASGTTMYTTREIDMTGSLTIDFTDVHWTVAYVFFESDGLEDFSVVNSNGDVLMTYYPEAGVMQKPDTVVGYSPLIKIGTGGAAIDDDKAVKIGNTVIGLDTPQTVSDGEISVTVNEVIVDSETYNAFTLVDGRTFNLNPYITIKGKLEFSGDEQVTCKMMDSVEYLKVIPRWWTI